MELHNIPQFILYFYKNFMKNANYFSIFLEVYKYSNFYIVFI